MVCDIGEYENLCAVVEAGTNIADVLVDYVASGRDDPLEVFLHHNHEGLREPKIVKEGFDRLFDMIVTSLDLQA